MQRVLIIAALLCLIGSAAYAEILCDCEQETCICFIQIGDEGIAVEAIQEALVVQGWLAANDDAAIFDEHTLQAVLAFQEANDLPATGTMDDDTLTLLLWGMLPDELDLIQPETSNLLMWIPTDGGTRHHDNPECSGMFDPRKVSQRNALAMGMLHCGRCKPDGYTKAN